MRIAILLFPGYTATDAIGPYEVLSRLPQVQLQFVAQQPGLVRSDTGFLQIECAALPPADAVDILIVPGGPNAHLPLQEATLLDWLRQVDRNSVWTVSVCTGALLLGAAGLLSGRRATTYWDDLALLSAYGANPLDQRYVFDGKYLTAAGVSAGYDMALALFERLAGTTGAMAVQLALAYDPQPPFDCGSPHKAPPALVAAVRAQLVART
jgi:transcriptional regulator GlxA family with amidase domain